MKKSITQSQLKEQLHYNPDTGIFTNRVYRSGRALKGAIAGHICNTHGYVIIKINEKRYQAHRLAWLYMYGNFPKDDIDHINHNRADNQIVNIRAVSRQENLRNKSKSKNNTSGVIGVSWSKNAKKWYAKIAVFYKQIHLGYFTDKSDAVNARKEAEKQYGFHKNHGVITKKMV